MSEYHQRIRSFLKSSGATGIDFVQKRHHARYLFRYREQNMSVVVGSTPSDHRAHKNAIAMIKRRMEKINDRQ